MLYVNGIADANAQLKKATASTNSCDCKCIKLLYIEGHAKDGVQLIGSKATPNFESNYLAALPNEHNDGLKDTPFVFVGLQLFAGVKFCDDATIELGGCHTGSGQAGAALYRAIGDNTHPTVQGWDEVLPI